jgi:hypothetical protein
MCLGNYQDDSFGTIRMFDLRLTIPAWLNMLSINERVAELVTGQV